MSSTLDDLFDQIIHSERRAQERKFFLNEIRTQTVQVEEEISILEQEHDALKGELVIKIHKLNEEEFTCKLMKNREMILSDQWSELKNTKERLTSELADMKVQFDLKRDKFCNEVKSFSTAYDFCGNGTAIREQEAQKAEKGLIEEEKHLSEEISSIEEFQRTLETKQLELDRKIELLLNLQKQQRDKEIELDEERKKTLELEREKEKVMYISQEDSEFVKLQKELEENKPGFLEEKCYGLQKEVQILQKRLWQKQVKQRKESWKQKQQKTSEWKTKQSSDSNESNDCEENLSQEDLNDIFNEDMTTTQINRQKRIFKPSNV